jgi:hypothetical protein
MISGDSTSLLSECTERTPRACVHIGKYFCIFARMRVWLMRMSSAKRSATSTRLKSRGEGASKRIHDNLDDTLWQTTPSYIQGSAYSQRSRRAVHPSLPSPASSQFTGNTRGIFSRRSRGFVREILGLSSPKSTIYKSRNNKIQDDKLRTKDEINFSNI